MKKFYQVISILTLSIIIAACGQSNDTGNLDDQNEGITNNGQQNNNNDFQNNENNVVDNDDTNQNEDQGTDSDDMEKKMEDLEYTDFELEVDYGNDQEYEAEIEQDKSTGVKAKLEDELSGVDIKGEEAFNEIFPMVEKLTIGQETSKEDAIKETLEVFGLDADYTKFELELTFKDGTKLEFEDRQ